MSHRLLDCADCEDVVGVVDGDVSDGDVGAPAGNQARLLQLLP